MVWFLDICDKPAAMWLCQTLNRICFKFPSPLFIHRPTLHLEQTGYSFCSNAIKRDLSWKCSLAWKCKKSVVFFLSSRLHLFLLSIFIQNKYFLLKIWVPQVHACTNTHKNMHRHTHTHTYRHTLTQTHFIPPSLCLCHIFIVYSSLRPCQTKSLIADFPLRVCWS